MRVAAVLLAGLMAMATLANLTSARPMYQSQIPNGNRVPNPCQPGAIWGGVGHQSPAGANARNPFGLDFKAAGFTWTQALCRKDSDGDGVTNGQELGDPDCVWTPGATPARTTGLSHPGICPLDSTTCINTWEVCPKAFNCPGMSEAGVTARNFTFKKTAVPAKQTTYICQAFELNNTATPMHLIGSLPVIDNKNVMHHMLMYGCTVRPAQAMFDSPQECFMANTNCSEILNLWAYGVDGECFNPNAGVLIGGAGYQYGLLQLHWNNPSLRTDFTDGSGFSLYYTSTLRKYNMGIMMYGEANLVLPPRQSWVNFNHTCPGLCSNLYHQETRYITSIGIHMHTKGIRGRISLWRNGSLVKDMFPLQVYDYNSPQMIAFDPPVEYRKGDEVKTECYFSTLTSNNSIFFGESTSDEMCLAFITYYPNNVSLNPVAKLSQCLAVSGINQCWVRSGVKPQIEQGCNITGMVTGEIPGKVLAEMSASGCFSRTGCDPNCRNYLTKTLWPGNACYDPKRARQMAELLPSGIYPINSSVSTLIVSTLYGQRFCEQEVTMLSNMDMMAAAMSAMTPPTSPAQPGPMQPGGLTSQHLLIIILVCSCFGFVLILAVLALIASRLHSAGAGAGGGGAGAAKTSGAPIGSAYVYENPVAAEKTEF